MDRRCSEREEENKTMPRQGFPSFPFLLLSVLLSIFFVVGRVLENIPEEIPHLTFESRKTEKTKRKMFQVTPRERRNDMKKRKGGGKED